MIPATPSELDALLVDAAGESPAGELVGEAVHVAVEGADDTSVVEGADDTSVMGDAVTGLLVEGRSVGENVAPTRVGTVVLGDNDGPTVVAGTTIEVCWGSSEVGDVEAVDDGRGGTTHSVNPEFTTE